EEEHRRLLPGQALEAHVRLDDETRAGRSQPLREAVPLVHRKHDAEMRNGDVVAVDRVRRLGARMLGGEVRHDLMAVEIEVDPLVGAAPLGTPEQSAVEGTRRGEIVDREREMEGLHSIPPSFERSDDRHAEVHSAKGADQRQGLNSPPRWWKSART